MADDVLAPEAPSAPARRAGQATPSAAAATVVRLRGVRKVYNAGTAVETEMLHAIDLAVSQGEFCAVVWPSGSGKSTLLSIIGLLDRPTSGLVAVCGEKRSNWATTRSRDCAGSALASPFSITTSSWPSPPSKTS